MVDGEYDSLATVALKDYHVLIFKKLKGCF